MRGKTAHVAGLQREEAKISRNRGGGYRQQLTGWSLMLGGTRTLRNKNLGVNPSLRQLREFAQACSMGRCSHKQNCIFVTPHKSRRQQLVCTSLCMHVPWVHMPMYVCACRRQGLMSSVLFHLIYGSRLSLASQLAWGAPSLFP